MSRRPKTAGEKLRDSLNAQLARASEDAREDLEWTNQEEAVLARAADAADRAEILNDRWVALANDPATDPALLVKVSGELRALERSITDLVFKVSPELGQAKSFQHQKAAQTRWNRSY